jgi:hypothetical protein
MERGKACSHSPLPGVVTMSARVYSDRILAPLLATARSLDWPQRRAFFDDLRADAPVMVAELEQLLTTSAMESPLAAHHGVLARLSELVHRRTHATPH